MVSATSLMWGFGASFIEPLEVDNTQPQTVGGQQYKIEHDDETGYYFALDDEGKWQVQYRFFFEPHDLNDYDAACHYMQTSPKTHFTQKRICSKATPEGRMSLSDLRLITTQNGTRTERDVADEAEFDTILQAQFGIDLAPARAAANRV